jgi:Skp family chaperone for outer membrane proteins
MKKVIFTTALIILATTFSQASSPRKMLTFKNAFGQILTMPVIEEVPQEEAFPFDQKAVFDSIQTVRNNQVFDISKMSKPEEEVDDIPAELKGVIAR